MDEIVNKFLLARDKEAVLMNRELLVAKLHAYGFSKDYLKIVLSYLSNRYQRVKVNTMFTSCTKFI